MWCIGEYSDQFNDFHSMNDIALCDDSNPEQESEVKEVEKSSDLIFDPLAQDMSDLLVDLSNPVTSGLDSPIDIDKKFFLSDDEGEDGSLKPSNNEETSNIETAKQNKTVDELEIIKRCQDVVTDPKINISTKEYALNALFKLSARFPNQSAQVKIFTDGCTTDLNLELQQRSIEFSTIFARHEDILPSVYERMPPIERPPREEEEELM